MNRPALFVFTMVAAGCMASRTSSAPASMAALSSEASSGIARLREATKSYRVLDSAVAAGYAAKVNACLVHEHHGAMGYHHTNAKYMDRTVDVTRPEILLYERTPAGEYRLNGVEFIVPYTAWPRDTIGPTVMGEKLKREDNLKFWYLHAWAWSENADGMFADFNPSVQCGADRRVFTPYVAPPPADQEIAFRTSWRE